MKYSKIEKMLRNIEKDYNIENGELDRYNFCIW